MLQFMSRIKLLLTLLCEKEEAASKLLVSEDFFMSSHMLFIPPSECTTDIFTGTVALRTIRQT